MPKKPIDLTRLSEDQDPELERELEEIALDTRGGLIGRGKTSYDVEKGNAIVPALRPSRPIKSSFTEEDEDKRGHSYLTESADRKASSKKRIALIVITLAALALTGSVLYIVLSRSKDGSDLLNDETTLTGRQQQIQTVLERITTIDVLNDPETPQYEARRWMLFRDSENIDLKEGTIVQRYALACLYFSSGGEENWKDNNWLYGPECDDEVWDGLSCNSNGQVRGILFGKS